MNYKIEYLCFKQENESKNMVSLLTEELMQMFDENNKLVPLFISIRDKYKMDISTMKLRLIGRRTNDGPEYELPTSRDIGGLIIGDIDDG